MKCTTGRTSRNSNNSNNSNRYSNSSNSYSSSSSNSNRRRRSNLRAASAAIAAVAVRAPPPGVPALRRAISSRIASASSPTRTSTRSSSGRRRSTRITIKKLLREQIDLPAQQVLKNHVVKLKTANATDVANNIRELYRQVMDVNPLPGQPGGDRFGFAMAFGNPNAGRPVDVNGNPAHAALTIGVDDRSNSLLVQASEAMFEEVKKLAEDLDEAAKNPNRKVQVRVTRGLDPTMVQQVVDTIQGRRSSNPTGLGGGLGGTAAGGGGFNRPFGGFGGFTVGGGPVGVGGGIGGIGGAVPVQRLPGGGGR